MTDTTPVNQIPLIAGNLQSGDVLVGERVTGTTVRIPVGTIGTVTSVNTQTGAVVLIADNISDTTSSHKFTNAADISRLASTSGTNTGDQTITLTGDVIGSGLGSFAATIANGAVTLAKQANLAANSFMGNNTGISATPLALTYSQTKTALSLNNVENTALSTWAGTSNITTLGTIGTGTWNATAITVTYGGSGRASATAYAPIVGGTTSTGVHQSTASGSTGQIFQSAGNAAVPTWSTPTYPSASGAARKILVSDGTNNVYSTETYAVPGSAGNLLRSDGTNWTAAKATLTTDVTGILPIANGGTNVTSVTTAPTATAFAGWDTNSNLSANNFLAGYLSTATAAGTTTLTVSSAIQQVFTGSTTQTCVLPVVSTLVLGTQYIITNLSTGAVTVQSSGTNIVQAMAANTTLIVQSNATSGTSASVWNVIAYFSAASDITGSGPLVRATAPALVAPVLGTPTSGTLSNCSGLKYLGAGKTTFHASRSTTQAITTGTYTKIQYNIVDYDGGSYYDGVTNYRFTPLIAGKYLILATNLWDTASTTELDLVIYKNGVPDTTKTIYNNTGYRYMQVYAIVIANGSTDYFEVYCFQNRGSNLNIFNDKPSNTFAGYLIEAT